MYLTPFPTRRSARGEHTPARDGDERGQQHEPEEHRQPVERRGPPRDTEMRQHRPAATGNQEQVERQIPGFVRDVAHQLVHVPPLQECQRAACGEQRDRGHKPRGLRYHAAGTRKREHDQRAAHRNHGGHGIGQQPALVPQLVRVLHVQEPGTKAGTCHPDRDAQRHDQVNQPHGLSEQFRITRTAEQAALEQGGERDHAEHYEHCTHGGLKCSFSSPRWCCLCPVYYTTSGSQSSANSSCTATPNSYAMLSSSGRLGSYLSALTSLIVWRETQSRRAS